mgnify:FL=1
MHIVMDPERFVGLETFKRNMSATCDELNAMPTADGYDKVYYPGERAQMRKEKAYKTGGIEIVDSIYEYLKSDDIHYNRYDHKNRFAE